MRVPLPLEESDQVLPSGSELERNTLGGRLVRGLGLGVRSRTAVPDNLRYSCRLEDTVKSRERRIKALCGEVDRTSDGAALDSVSFDVRVSCDMLARFGARPYFMIVTSHVDEHEVPRRPLSRFLEHGHNFMVCDDSRRRLGHRIRRVPRLRLGRMATDSVDRHFVEVGWKFEVGGDLRLFNFPALSGHRMDKCRCT